ncbi:MAG: hypothetical protein WB609_14780 [Candidatus Cybelea sp.]
MSKLPYVALLLACLGFLPAVAPASAPAPVEVASNRCNGQMVDESSGRVRDYDRHSAGNGSTQLLQRYGALGEIISVLNEEREILNNVCASDAQKAPFFAQIAATSAWALVLQADLAARLSASCPAAATALPTMMISDAWLAIANVVNDDSGVVPAAFHDIIPKVQTHAQTLGLTLPAWSETSAYWRDQVHAKEKTAIAGCPSPPPTPTPAPLPT